jgi:hypothetical protein
MHEKLTNPFELLIEDDTERIQATDDIKASISDFKLEIKNALDQLVWDLTECNKQYVDAGIADTSTRECIAAKAAGVYDDGSGEREWSQLIYDALYEVR